MFGTDIEDLAARLVAIATAKGLRIATAESCTGGLVAAAICGVAGASTVFERGVVAYSNAAKSQLLGVDPGLIGWHGAVSFEVAQAMTQGAWRAEADLVLTVTGIAGPGGGSPQKPVGTVWFGLANGGTIHSEMKLFEDVDRGGVQKAALKHGLTLLCEGADAR